VKADKEAVARDTEANQRAVDAALSTMNAGTQGIQQLLERQETQVIRITLANSIAFSVGGVLWAMGFCVVGDGFCVAVVAVVAGCGCGACHSHSCRTYSCHIALMLHPLMLHATNSFTPGGRP
jgi:hypothetical protein